jgi:putative transposase
MFEQRSFRRFLPHYQWEGGTFFDTFVTRDRFELPPAARDIALRHVVFDHERRMHLRVATVMPDHVHMIYTPLWNDRGETFGIGEIRKGIKGCSTRAINLALGRSGSLWLPEGFDREIRNDQDLLERTEYILMNAVEKKLAATPDEYPWLWREWVEGRRET